MTDRWFKIGLLVAPAFLITLVGGMAFTLMWGASSSFQQAGWGFYTQLTWDPVHHVYGGGVFILGSVVTTLLALCLAIPVALAIGLFTGYYFTTGPIAVMSQWVLDLLASVPSVIFGFWGLMVMVPAVRNIEMWLGVAPYGVGLFSGSVVLATMMIPLTASLIRESVATVSAELKEGALALGATPLEVVRHIVWPISLPGIGSAIMLGFGRAIGETMAVTMVVGNANHLPTHLFDPTNTIASLIASEFGETSDPVVVAHLIHLGLILLALSLAAGMLGRYIIRKQS